jgi:hypothetical protein
MQIGDKIVWCSQLNSPNQIREGTVTKTRAGDMPLVWVDSQHKPEDCIYEAYCWPARVKTELVAILTERQRLQKVADDSMKLIYQLRNAIGREEK